MLFYKTEVSLKSEGTVSKRDNPEEYYMFVSEMKENSEGFFKKSGESSFFFASKLIKKRLTVGVILKKACDLEQELSSYLKSASAHKAVGNGDCIQRKLSDKGNRP